MGKLYVKNRYGQIPCNILNDKTISIKAKGLWVFIQSKPDGWNFSAKRISCQLKEGIDSVKSGIKELEKNGLLKRRKTKNHDGRWSGCDYFLLEKPEKQSVENQPTENQLTENTLNISNKDYSNKDYSNKDYRSLKKGGDLSKNNKIKPSFIKNKLVTYLCKQLESTNLKSCGAEILKFFEYRMTEKIRGKETPYGSTHGIDGLLRDILACKQQGLNIKDCIEETMLNEWLTPNPSYFPNNHQGNNRNQENATTCQEWAFDY